MLRDRLGMGAPASPWVWEGSGAPTTAGPQVVGVCAGGLLARGPPRMPRPQEPSAHTRSRARNQPGRPPPPSQGPCPALGSPGGVCEPVPEAQPPVTAGSSPPITLPFLGTPELALLRAP